MIFLSFTWVCISIHRYSVSSERLLGIGESPELWKSLDKEQLFEFFWRCQWLTSYWSSRTWWTLLACRLWPAVPRRAFSAPFFQSLLDLLSVSYSLGYLVRSFVAPNRPLQHCLLTTFAVHRNTFFGTVFAIIVWLAVGGIIVYNYPRPAHLAPFSNPLLDHLPVY